MEILVFFWDRRVVIAKIVAGFLIFGFLVVLFSRVEYEASTTLMPESQTSQTSASSLLRQYGGLFGISGGGQMADGGISTGLYPDIIASLPYQVELMNEPIYFSTLDTTITPHEYFRDVYPPSTMEYIEKYTIGLPGQIINLIKGGSKETEPLVTEVDRDSVVSLPGQQRGSIGKLKDRIIISNEGGLITLTVEFPDPRAAAEIANKAITLLKQYVLKYRTQKANEELEFVWNQVQEAKKRWEAAQMRLAEFRDSNVNLNTAKAQTQVQRLQSQYDLAFNLYNTLSQNLEQAKLKVQENTPVFTVVEPIQVPTSNSKPNTRFIIILSILAGLAISFIYLVARRFLENFQTYLTGKN